MQYDIKVLFFKEDHRANFGDRSSGGPYIKIHEKERETGNVELKHTINI